MMEFTHSFSTLRSVFSPAAIAYYLQQFVYSKSKTIYTNWVITAINITINNIINITVL